MSRYLTLLLAILFFIAARTSAAGVQRALVIGNDAYRERPLSSCVNDAKAFSAWLVEVGYEPKEVQLITNATKVQMVSALEALATATSRRQHDQVVIYYSGHGTKVRDDNGDEGREDGVDEALLPIDNQRSPVSAESLIIRDDQFHALLRRISSNTSQVIVVLDSCFSGGAMKGPVDSRFERPKKHVRAEEIAGLEPLAPAALSDSVSAQQKGSTSIGVDFLEYGQKRGRGGLVFFSASSELEPASAAGPGETLSVFTAAFLRTARSHSQTGTTLSSFLLDLRSQLKGVQQPQLITDQIDVDTLLTPGLFASVVQVEGERRFSEVLEKLIHLPFNQHSQWRLDVRCHPANTISIGSTYDLRITPSHSGYLVVFTVQADGTVTFLYPNCSRINNFVESGVEVAVPWEGALEAAPPAGKEQFYVYLLNKNPFRGHDLSKFEGVLPVGDMEDIVRRRPKLTSIQQLQGLLRNGPRQVTYARNPSSVHWTRAMVTVNTVQH